MIIHGHVYFARVNGSGPIKIGFSSNLPVRMGSLSRIAWGLKTSCLAKTPGNRGLEARFLRHYWDDHMGHEWFEPSPRLLADIEAVRDGRFDIRALPVGPHPLLSAAGTERHQKAKVAVKIGDGTGLPLEALAMDRAA